MLFVLILLNLIFVTSTTGSWHQLDGIEYYIEYTAVNGVDKAKEGCKAINAILAAVKSQRIQDFLVKNINTTKLKGQPYSFYIGLSRVNSTTLLWSDGTTTNTSVFTYWDVSDKNYESRKPCVTMGWDGGLNGYKWKIVECWKTNRYICQRKANASPLATTTKAATAANTLLVSNKGSTTIHIADTTNKIKDISMGTKADYLQRAELDKTPSWVIPAIAILSATVVFMLALVLYLWKRNVALKAEMMKRAGDVKDNMDMRQASGHITPYATTSGYQQQYENMKATETAYEEFNGK